MSPLVLLLLALFLFPIAVYCSILGLINRRPSPLVVSGAWDFLGVLLATSGFLLFVGPALLSGVFRQTMRDVPLYSGEGTLATTIGEIWSAWWVLWLVYYGFVLGGAAFLLWARGNTTVIYNIDGRVFDVSLARAAGRLGFNVDRRGNRLYLVKASHVATSGQDSAEHAVTPDQIMPAPAPDAVVIDLEPFPLLSNMCMHWQSAASADRADMERELRSELATAAAPDSSTGGWLLSIGAMLFILVMVMTGFFIFLVMMLVRR